MEYLSRLNQQYQKEVSDRRHSDHLTSAYKNLGLDDSLRKWSFGALPLLQYLPVERLEGANVLDFGCGAGFEMAAMLKLCKEEGPSRLHGIDLCQQMLDQGKMNFSTINTPVDIQWFSNLEEIKTSNQEPYHFILSNAVIHLNPNKTSLIQSLSSFLEEHGEIYCAEFMTSSPIPQILKSEYEKSDGSFLFGALETVDFMVDSFYEADFDEVEILKQFEFDPKPEIEKLLRLSHSKTAVEQTMEQLSNIHFYIVVMRAQEKLESLFGSFSCHSCKAFNPRQNGFFRSLNSRWNRNLYQRFLRKEIQVEQCDQCRTLQFPFPFQIHIMESKKMIYCFPKNFESQKQGLLEEIITPTKQRLPHYEVQLIFDPISLNL